MNKATPGLFKAFPGVEDYAAASPEQIEPHIRTIGLFRSKAVSIHAACSRIVSEFGGEVPDRMEDLLTLRGVARKTAGVVLGNAFGISPAFWLNLQADYDTRMAMREHGREYAAIAKMPELAAAASPLNIAFM